MLPEDEKLTRTAIGQLEDVPQLIHFFAKLGYNVDDAIALVHAVLGTDTEDLQW